MILRVARFYPIFFATERWSKTNDPTPPWLEGIYGYGTVMGKEVRTKTLGAPDGFSGLCLAMSKRAKRRANEQQGGG